MGIPGPKPKPAGLRLLEGNRSHRRVREGVKVALKAPTCPEWLSAIAKTEWRRITPRLEKLGLVGEVDMAALAAYCENLAIVVQCSNFIRRKGGYAKYLSGKNSQTAPHLVAMNKAFEKIRAFCSEFGMTPSSRGRMDTPNTDDASDEELD
jgi:P27 family predicted phage terminase small subunit